MTKFLLNNKLEIPAIGLGTFPMKGITLVRTVLRSISIGYTSFDTASAYGNEKALGYALKLCRKRRNELFITTKLSNHQQRNGSVRDALKKSLSNLKLRYVDLYLMHWPNPGTFLDSWIQMEKLYKEGYCKAIGVCNFHKHHLEMLLEVATVIPAVNQIEHHPLLTQENLVSFCRSLDIKVEAYSPLARMDEKLLNNTPIRELARKYSKTVPQIILRWNLQRGIISIPKTENKQRLKENINVFDFKLQDEEIALISSQNKDYRVRHDPDNCDFSKL